MIAMRFSTLFNRKVTKPPTEMLSADLTGKRPLEARLGQSLGEYWLDRARIHLADTYAGIPMNKFPEDLRVYEQLLWENKPNVVIEIGCYEGGSALWFRDRLRTLENYQLVTKPLVVSVDLNTGRAASNICAVDSHYAKSIVLMNGDVTDPSTSARVRALLPPGARCMVVEDSAHTYETTASSLRHFSDFVAIGGYMVVEDGCVDMEPLRLNDSWPSGVLPALDDWLETEQGRGFAQRRDLERYLVTCHPRGFLQRT
jgi:cephalosporin hydroxylase